MMGYSEGQSLLIMCLTSACVYDLAKVYLTNTLFNIICCFPPPPPPYEHVLPMMTAQSM